MAKVIQVTCDCCGKNLSQENYQTLSIRRYAHNKHDKAIRIPTLWMCDKCYARFINTTICVNAYHGGEC